MTHDLDELGNLMRQLANLVGQLENFAPGRKFTLDGHWVGSVGDGSRLWNTE